MKPQGVITLQQGIAKKSGNPYLALKLRAGKWTALHFPTQFEAEYLVEYLKEQKGSFTLDENNEVLKLVVGDYVDDFTVDSKFEYKYLVDYFRVPVESLVSDSADDKLDLSSEDEIKTNPFND